MFDNANEIITMIEQRKNRGYGLEHFREYMKSIHNPHEQLRAIHVAGTNGKGSTTNDIRSILQAAGYRVGTFTSPYMITHLDRICINQTYISEADFIDITNTYYASWIQWDLSMFEIDMCIACIYFLKEQVDFCVFEVGLGGRLDSTNILMPLVSVITNIGMDHMELLGDTYESIAFEKAGIIKPHTMLITGEQRPSCLAVFQSKCEKMQSEIQRIDVITDIAWKQNHRMFTYRTYRDIELATGAKYQCKNAALALETILYLKKERIIQCDEQSIRIGLKRAKWIGRYEIVEQDPIILLDGAHNMDGIQALCASIQDIKNPVIIFSVLKDKKFEEMLAQLEQVSDHIIVTQLQHNERALDIHELQEKNNIYLEEDIDIALQKARAFQRPIVITGSLYFISDIRKRYFA